MPRVGTALFDPFCLVSFQSVDRVVVSKETMISGQTIDFMGKDLRGRDRSDQSFDGAGVGDPLQMRLNDR